MRGLLLRLADLDPDAGASLRVIEYFDRLVSNSASLEALTRASAALSGCTAGLRDAESGWVIRFDSDGLPGPPLEQQVVIESPVLVDEVAVAHVWLERAEPHPLDEILVERMAVTAAARWRPFSVAEGVDPALVELVIGSATEDQDRARALRLLGLSPTHDLRVLAISVSSGDVNTAIRELVRAIAQRGGTARGATLGMTGAVIVQAAGEAFAELGLSVGAGVHIGLGGLVAASRAAESWAQAKVAVRFRGAWHEGCTVNHDDLGALALLATIPGDKALANRDVEALAALARTERGHQDITVLLAVALHGSARQAANELHMHHSSVTSRLRHVEAALGISVDDPVGWLRAQLAAFIWRLTV